MIQTPKPDSKAATPRPGKKGDRYQNDQLRQCQDDGGFATLSAGRFP